MKSKQKLRSSIHEALLQLDDSYISRISHRIMDTIRSHYSHYDYFFVYISMQYEVQTRHLIDMLLSHHKHVYVPVLRNNVMYIKQIFAPLGYASWKTMWSSEVKEDLSVRGLHHIVAIVPGLAFTLQGDRLGRGGGFYDEWINYVRSHYTGTIMIGVCFENQLVESLPLQGHDEKVDFVETVRNTSSTKRLKSTT